LDNLIAHPPSLQIVVRAFAIEGLDPDVGVG
jgi:hypothetical protein